MNKQDSDCCSFVSPLLTSASHNIAFPCTCPIVGLRIHRHSDVKQTHICVTCNGRFDISIFLFRWQHTHAQFRSASLTRAYTQLNLIIVSLYEHHKIRSFVCDSHLHGINKFVPVKIRTAIILIDEQYREMHGM